MCNKKINVNRINYQASKPAPDETICARRKARLTSKAFHNKFNLVMVNVKKNFSSIRECIDEINAFICSDDYSVVKEELYDKLIQYLKKQKVEKMLKYTVATCYEAMGVSS